MNKEYTLIDGKCIIEDENRNKRVEEYADKTDEILIQENVIEMLQKDLFNTKRNFEKQIRMKKSIKSDKWFNLSLLIMPIIAVQIAFRLLLGPSASSIMIQMHPLLTPFVKGIAVFFSITFGGIGILTSFFDSRENKRKIKGLESKQEAIEKTLENEKEFLKELNETKQKQESKESFYTKKVDDLETINEMRDYLYLYYDCGINKEKYENYLEKGILEKKLSKKYTEEGIRLIKEWIEEKQRNEMLKQDKELVLKKENIR